MKWNHVIIVIFICFFLSLGVMVRTAMKQRVDMIDDHYYEKELAYQSVIDAKDNYKKLDDTLSVVFNGIDLVLTLPIDAAKDARGKIELLRPSDSEDDKHMEVHPDQHGVIKIATKELLSGEYYMRARWYSGGREYYKEQAIFVKK